MELAGTYKQRAKNGFTMVELVVVLVILAILAAMTGGGLTAYVRLARFEQNEANARSLYQAAQIALTRRSTAGTLDGWLAGASDQGVTGAGYAGTEAEQTELKSRVRALFYDRENPDTEGGRLVKALLEDYVYDDSLWNASLCLEVDVTSGRVYSVFYAAGAPRLRFGGETDISDRSYEHRRGQSLVGYYGTGLVDVVSLKQIKLKVQGQQLINGETLTLNWSGNSRGQDNDVTYEVVFYDASGGSRLFKVQVDLNEQAALYGFSKSNPVAQLPVTRYDAAGQPLPDGGQRYAFPLHYAAGRFTLTLDAMVSADILQRSSQPGICRSSLFSVTRFVEGAGDLYATVQAVPNRLGEQEYTPGRVSSPTNTENALFASADESGSVTLTAFRHLYNLRFMSGRAVNALFGRSRLDWTGGGVVVYQPSAQNGGAPEPRTPTSAEAVAFPTIPELEENQTLTGGSVVLRGVQLRTESVAPDAEERTLPNGEVQQAYQARYVGLFGVNRGEISGLTLQNADVAVNLAGAYATAAEVREGLRLAGSGVAPADRAGLHRQLRGVGALCGLNTGELHNIQLTGSATRVAGAVTFGESPVTDGTAADRTVVYLDSDTGNAVTVSEMRGVGGVAGILREAVTGTAQPERSRAFAVSGLQVSGGTEEGCGVIGLLIQQNETPAAGTESEQQEKQRYLAASGQFLPVGTGGVAGVVAVSQKADGTARLTDLVSGVTVVGNGYTGGVAGSLLGTGTADVRLTGLKTTGAAVLCASRSGGPGSMLGQFFGGITGYLNHAQLQNCTSAAGAGRYALDAAGLKDQSLLRGDFVGGITGFARNAGLDNCSTVTDRVFGSDGYSTTARGFVLGRKFVGGLVGGSAAGTLTMTSGSNVSHVFGSRYVGGIVAVNGGNCTVTEAVNGGLVAGLGGQAAYVGGIAGINDGSWGVETPGSAVLTQCSVVVWNEELITSDNQRATYYQLLAGLHAGEADFVGGVAGYVGANGAILDTGSVTVVLVGRDFVGGVAGCFGADAAEFSGAQAAGYVSGRDCVGGILGLCGRGEITHAAGSAIKEVKGRCFVGGVAGAVLVGESGLRDGAAAFTMEQLRTTNPQGLVRGDAVVGGVIGYLEPGRSLPVEGTFSAGATRAEQLSACLPVLTEQSHVLAIPAIPAGGSAIRGIFRGLENNASVRGGILTGGVVGVCAGAALLDAPVNRGSLQCSAVTAEFQPNSVALAEQTGNDFFAPEDRGALLGGIAGMTGPAVTVQDAVNSGSVYGTANGVGGTAGLNLGTLLQCANTASFGNSQQNEVGGVAGINGSLLQNCDPGSSVTGGEQVGGLAGVNLSGGTVSADAAWPVQASVSGSRRVGGVTGLNAGTITAAAVGKTAGTLTVSGIDEVGGVAGVNQNIVSAGVTVGDSVSVFARGSSAGGVAGRNSGAVGSTGAAVISRAVVHANGDDAGGIAGLNDGIVTGAEVSGSVSTSRTNAGGIAGRNLGTVTGGRCGGSVTANGGAAGGAAAVNNGTITGIEVDGSTVQGTAGAIGLVAAYNEAEGRIVNAVVNGGTLKGHAVAAGGIAGSNQGVICAGTGASGRCIVTGSIRVQLSASVSRVTMGGAVGRNGGQVTGVQVDTSLTEQAERYQNLGGVAGENDGTLLQCTYTGMLGSQTAAPQAGDALGGIVGRNNGTVTECAVPRLELSAKGAFDADNSHSAAEKLALASHVGGVAGRNDGTVQRCTVGSAGTVSHIWAGYGFVGGVAGSNSGSILRCGGDGTGGLLRAMADTFTDTMTAIRQGSADYSSLYGVDPVMRNDHPGNVYDTAQPANQCVVALRGGAGYQYAQGALGGLTGFNSTTGLLQDCATGQWFIYGDNVSLDSAVGGVIGQNQSDAMLSGLANLAAVRRYIRCPSRAAATAGQPDTDDQNNPGNDRSAGGSQNNDAYVGGVIGWQENNTSNQWGLTNAVNCGSVCNSRSNDTGGVIAYWTANGGTIRNCFNFGQLFSNMHNGENSGTAGGIVGFFNYPTSGDTVNIISCQNWGGISHSANGGANDVAGIVGKVNLSNLDYDMVINVVDCVNGDAALYARSMVCGIFGYLGPWNTSQAVQNVRLNIDRCRNFSTALYVVRNSAVGYSPAYSVAGIVGNRGARQSGTKPTTVTNCFTVWRKNPSSYSSPIALTRGNENVQFSGNFYVEQTGSFALGGLTAGLHRSSAAAPAGGPFITSYRLFDTAEGRNVEVTGQTQNPDFDGWVRSLFDGQGGQANFKNTSITGHASYSLTLYFSEEVEIASIQARQQFYVASNPYPIKHGFTVNGRTVTTGDLWGSAEVVSELLEAPVRCSSLTIGMTNEGDWAGSSGNRNYNSAWGREHMGLSELVLTTGDGSVLLLDSTGEMTPAAPETKDGVQLFVGRDLDAAGLQDAYFAARPLVTGIQGVSSANSHIAPAEPGQPETIVSHAGTVQEAALLLHFGEKGSASDRQAAPDVRDITDETIQAYYAGLLEAEVPGAPQDVQVFRSEETQTVFGRYEAVWQAPEQGSVRQYRVRVFVAGDGQTEYRQEMEADVYETRFTFQPKEEWKGRRFYVEVTASNSKGDSSAARSGEEVFAQPMPVPGISIRLEEGKQYLVLEAESVAALNRTVEQNHGWQVTAWLDAVANVNSDTARHVFTNEMRPEPNGELRTELSASTRRSDNTPVGIDTTLRAYAEPTGDLRDPGGWFRSDLLNEQIYLPAGYPEGTLQVTEAGLTGDSDLSLKAAVTFSFARTGSSPAPVYQVCLMAQCTTDKWTVNGSTSLRGQYITLAQQTVTMQEERTCVFDSLPADLFDGFDVSTVTAVVIPAASGKGPVYTWRTAAEQEIADAIAAAGETPVWHNGWQILAGEDGFTWRKSAPLEDAAVGAAAGACWKQAFRRTALAAPDDLTAQAAAEGDVLRYTFRWSAVAQADAYRVSLLGEIANADGTTVWEEIELDPETHASSVTVAGSVLADVNADGWLYNRVRLSVTSLSSDSSVIGRTAGKDIIPVQRLPRIAAPGVDKVDDTTMQYTIAWADPGETFRAHIARYIVYADVVKIDSGGGRGAAAATQIAATADADTLRVTVDLEDYLSVDGGDTWELTFYVVAEADPEDPLFVNSARGVSVTALMPSREDRPAPGGMALTYLDNGVTTAVTDGSVVPVSTLYDGLRLTLTLTNGDMANQRYDVESYYYDDREEAAAAVAAQAVTGIRHEVAVSASANASAPGGTLTGTLRANWQDAGRYVVVRLRARGNMVASHWVYALYGDGETAIPLPAMQLDTPDGVFRPQEGVPCAIQASDSEAMTGTYSDELTMSLYTLEWQRPAQAAQAQGSYVLTLHHAAVTDAGGQDATPEDLTVTIQVDPDGGIRAVTRDGEAAAILPDADGGYDLSAADARWTETLKGVYRDGDQGYRYFEMKLAPRLTAVMALDEEQRPVVTGYRVTLADIYQFDPAIQNQTGFTKVFTEGASLSARPGEGMTMLRDSGTGRVTLSRS